MTRTIVRFVVLVGEALGLHCVIYCVVEGFVRHIPIRHQIGEMLTHAFPDPNVRYLDVQPVQPLLVAYQLVYA